MRLQNKWMQGEYVLRPPPLPAALVGSSSCTLQQATFDTDIGREGYIAILEDPDYCAKLTSLSPFNFHSKSGAIRTSHGLILFFVFQIFEGERNECTYETFLNPYRIETIQMLSGAGQQSHLKVLLVNSVSAECCNWWEFDNTFNLNEVAANVARAIGNKPAGRFEDAQQEVRDNYSLDDLLQAQ